MPPWQNEVASNLIAVFEFMDTSDNPDFVTSITPMPRLHFLFLPCLVLFGISNY